MFHLSLSFLGPPQIEHNNRVVKVTTRKTLALLVYLTLSHRPRHREELVALLWPEINRENGLAALRRTLANLQNTIGYEWFSTNRQSIGLAQSSKIWVDVLEFNRLLAPCQGVPTSDKLCNQWLFNGIKAIHLYQGDFLTGFTLSDCPEWDTWQWAQTEQLRRNFGFVLEKVARMYMLQQNPETAIPYAQRWLLLNNLHEPAHRLLMMLYHQNGERANFLHQYQICKHILHEELNIEPETETTDLYLRLCHEENEPTRWNQATSVNKESPDEEVGSSILVGSAFFPRIPMLHTPFIGRQLEIDTLANALTDTSCRLITITGIGGVGKTRLILEAAMAYKDLFSDGVYFIPLAAVSSSMLINSVIARAMNFTFQGSTSPEIQLQNYLQSKHILLLLDSFEHLLQGGTQLVTTLLSRTSHLKLLIASQECLHIPEERLLRIQGLVYPTITEKPSLEEISSYSAVQLFLATAQRIRPSFTPHANDLPSLVHICRLLDGLPLAIELVAPLIQGISLSEMAQELIHNLTSLPTIWRNTPIRHHTLQAVFDHAWQRLTPNEQKTLQRLSVFQNEFSLFAAKQITETTPFVLFSLVDKSLVSFTKHGRYSLPQSLRQYLISRLSKHSADYHTTHHNHCIYYTTFLEKRLPGLKIAQQKESLQEIVNELENILAAWQWAIAQSLWPYIDRCLDTLFHFYRIRGLFTEGLDIFSQTLYAIQSKKESAYSTHLLIGRLLTRQAYFYMYLSQFAKAEEVAKQSLAIYKQVGKSAQTEVGVILNCLGGIAYHNQQKLLARQLFEQSLTIFTQFQDTFYTANVISNLGTVATNLKEYKEAEQQYRQSLVMFREMGNFYQVAVCLNNLSHIEEVKQTYHNAYLYLKESLALCREFGFKWLEIIVLHNHGHIACLDHDYVQAQQWYEESLYLRQQLGDIQGVSITWSDLGNVAFETGEYQVALSNLSKALQIAFPLGNLPVIQEIIWRMAQCFTSTSQYPQAMELITWLLRCPTIDHTIKNQAEGSLAQLETKLPQEALTRLQNVELDLKELLARIHSQQAN